jgi:hypothetical protein
MHVLARLNIAGGVADWVAVLYDILSLSDVTKGVLMTVGEIDIYVIKLIY